MDLEKPLSAQELWSLGTPLSQAAFEFSSFGIERPLRAIGRLKRGFPQNHRSKRAQYGTEQKVADQNNLLDRLKGGDLLAVGYRESSKLDTKPSLIPVRFLELNYMNFEKEEISAYEHVFQFVRICAPLKRLQKKCGRPRVAEYITLAMFWLEFERDIPLHEGPYKKHIPAIRERFKKFGHAPALPSDRTILKYYRDGLQLIARDKRRAGRK
jgi:hypothetical protein